MTTMKELLVHGIPKLTGHIHQVPIPTPGPGEVLIKVIAAGLNPKDWKFTESRPASSALNIGDDIAGIIHAVGPDVYEYHPGDRVAAFHRMAEPHGAYAEFAIAPVTTTFLLPPNISFESGAGLPLSAMTAAIALYQALKLPLPTAEGKKVPVLIYGGATAVGAFALQLAKLSGLGPIVTVAGKGREFVEGLGAADAIVDYREGDVVGKVLGAFGGAGAKVVLDAVSGGGSWKIVSEILERSGGGEVNMLDPPEGEWTWPEIVRHGRTFVASAYYKGHTDISEEQAKKDGDFAFWFYRYLSLLLARGDFKPHPVEVLDGGLEGVVGGIQALLDGKVSAKKLVVRISDTPGL
ncbi:hypothetical protein OQA88_9274 [Cercophora sp. LCS_1]